MRNSRANLMRKLDVSEVFSVSDRRVFLKTQLVSSELEYQYEMTQLEYQRRFYHVRGCGNFRPHAKHKTYLIG